FVDFGAMRVDSVAVDLARLCGSFLGGSDWSTPLSDYQLKRQLSEVERELVDEIDIGNALLTTVQWLDWLFLERREFENVERVRQRMEEAAERLRQL
ncbi:MAG: hypothetical protein KC561_21740, partial [Myxococcales bacterium]|nr:hypothetical protein [Myxococcales bacterium]